MPVRGVTIPSICRTSRIPVTQTGDQPGINPDPQTQMCPSVGLTEETVEGPSPDRALSQKEKGKE
ncbi:MAG TPA: hypothetical protein VGO47_09195 [Chlamydiales bacterium]|nr:hypothetical protein [Chlamydiales bacterium]